MSERCYRCGRAYRPGEESIGVMARPRSKSGLKEHYTFKSRHYPQCPDGAKKLNNRFCTNYSGSKITKH